MNKLRNKLIKVIGGVPYKEHKRLEEKYQALLDSRNKTETTMICNEYMYRLLRDLYNYTCSLYGNMKWQDKVFNVIKNNMLRIVIRYLHSGSCMHYKLDTTLDNPGEFLAVLREDGTYDEYSDIIDNIIDTDCV